MPHRRTATPGITRRVVKGDLSISLTGVPNGTLVALQHWALESPAIFVLVSDQRLCATDDKRHLLLRVLRRERVLECIMGGSWWRVWTRVWKNTRGPARKRPMTKRSMLIGDTAIRWSGQIVFVGGNVHFSHWWREAKGAKCCLMAQI